VALIGPAGALAGAVYFVIGATISGASLVPQFLPPFWRIFGEGLPTGSGTYLLRNDQYFAHAGDAAAYLTVGLYAGLGALLIVVTNLAANHDGTSTLDLDLVSAVAGEPEPMVP
jgi:hypothetical protein